MTYKISKEAAKGLENIWFYTFENWSGEQADRYYNLIVGEIEYLAANPTSGKDYSHVRKGYFRSEVKSRLVFYKINRKAGMIEIITILHQQMDIESRLSD